MIENSVSSRLIFPGLVALVLGVFVLGACGGGSNPASTHPSPTAASGVNGMPAYHPSTEVSRSGDHSSVLRTPDPVEQVASWYASTIQNHGWETVSQSSAPESANFTVKRGGNGVSISIGRSGSDTIITLTSYPTG